VAVGAGVTVILATLTGFPISTTHALTGAMVGSGWVAVGSQVSLGVLGKAFFLPLLLSPLLAVALGASLYLTFRWLRLQLGITKEWCICVGKEQQVVPMPQPSSVLALQAVTPIISACVDEQSQCEQRYAGGFFGIGSQQTMDAAHFFSAGVVSFARGLNDTPKMAALLMILPELGARSSLVAVAVAIAVGGLLSARRVAETMSHKITSMNHGQGFSANFATGLLVMAASLFGLPVSTTHVSVGALFGIGLTSRQADFRVIRNILLSWLVTLPCAAIIGALVYWFMKH
jgi:PiT family inorganic phosphate transporter